MAKASVAQRESEGVVVPRMGVQHNAPGGKGPCFGHARVNGAGKGMVRTTGPNHPDGHPLIDVNGLLTSDGVRRLPPELYLVAEPQPIAASAFSHHHRRDVRWETGRSCLMLSRMPQGKAIGKPDEGKPHVRFERGSVETGRVIAVPRH